MVRLTAQLLRPYRRFLLIILVAMVVQVGMTLLGPWPFKMIIDSVGSNHPVPQWVNWYLSLLGGGDIKLRTAMLAAAMVVIIAVVNGIASYCNFYLSASIGQWIGNDLRMRIYRHLQRLSLSYYRTRQVGAILSTITDDVATMQSFVSRSMLGMFMDVLTVSGMLVVMFALRWDFALMAVAVVPFVIFFRLTRRIGHKQGNH